MIIEHSRTQIFLDTVNYSLNEDDFEPNLCFYDSSQAYYYVTLLRRDKDVNKYKVIYNGLLRGYLQDAVYNYRFSFERFIAINHFRDINVPGTFSSQFESGLNSSIYICINYGTSFYGNNASNLETINGEMWLKSNKTISDIISDYKWHFNFWDARNLSATARIPDIRKVPVFEYYPVTIYSGQVDYDVFDANNNLIDSASGIVNPYSVGSNTILIPASSDAKRIVITIYDEELNGTVYTINVVQCGNVYYYWSKYGLLDMLYTTATRNEQDNVEKKYINVSEKKYNVSTENTQKISQHTGFECTESQIRDIINAPFIFHNAFEIYHLDNTNFTGYNGLKLSEKNIELVMTSTEAVKRYSSFKLNFFD